MSTVPVPDTSSSPTNALLENRGTQSAREYVNNYIRRLRAGDLGVLPIIFGIIVITVIFQSRDANFLTARNLVNLIVQMAAYTTIGYGIVFVLLLGEIDLSVGYVSAVVGVSVTLMLRPPHQFLPWFLAIPFGLLIGAAIGTLQGLIITFFQLPAFVVTLAGLLAWNGVVLKIIGNGGTVSLQDPFTISIANSFLPSEAGWLVAVLGVAAFVALRFWSLYNRRKKGLATTPPAIIVAQIVFLAVCIVIVVYICNLDRGVPSVGLLMLGMLVGLTYLAQNTRFGRYIYAIGGNKEAARRAGIRVERYRVLVFMIASTMAGMGGIILASRLRSVATNAGGGNILLNSIAAAVIGGTSLFGGRGSISSAILGAVIIAGIENGMGLIALSAGDQLIVTGLVLLAAVVIDAISRRNQKRSGLT